MLKISRLSAIKELCFAEGVFVQHFHLLQQALLAVISIAVSFCNHVSQSVNKKHVKLFRVFKPMGVDDLHLRRVGEDFVTLDTEVSRKQLSACKTQKVVGQLVLVRPPKSGASVSRDRATRFRAKFHGCNRRSVSLAMGYTSFITRGS